MNGAVSKLFRVLRFPLLISTAVLPIAMILVGKYAPELTSMVWLWPVSYLVLDGLGTQVRGRLRPLFAVGQILALALVTLVPGWVRVHCACLLLPALYGGLLLMGLALSPRQRNEEIPGFWYFSGILVHLIAQVFLLVDRTSGGGVLQPMAGWILADFFAHILIILISLNQAQLVTAAGGRQNPPLSMLRKNLMLIAGFFAAALLIAFLPKVAEGITALFQMVMKMIGGFLALVSQLFEMEATPGAAPGAASEGMLPMAEDAKTMPVWLDYLLRGVAFLLVTAAVIGIIVILARKIIALTKKLKLLLTRYLHAVSEDYVDEITDTREDRSQTQYRDLRERRLSARHLRRLSPTQQIRHRYRVLLGRHPEWSPGSTARENLNASAARIYEQIRYGGRDAGEDDARRFASETKKL